MFSLVLLLRVPLLADSVVLIWLADGLRVDLEV
jgi:hypothetical protein